MKQFETPIKYAYIRKLQVNTSCESNYISLYRSIALAIMLLNEAMKATIHASVSSV